MPLAARAVEKQFERSDLFYLSARYIVRCRKHSAECDDNCFAPEHKEEIILRYDLTAGAEEIEREG